MPFGLAAHDVEHRLPGQRRQLGLVVGLALVLRTSS